MKIGQVQTYQHIPDGPKEGDPEQRGFEVELLDQRGETVTLWVSVTAGSESEIALEHRDALADGFRESLSMAEHVAEQNDRIASKLVS